MSKQKAHQFTAHRVTSCPVGTSVYGVTIPVWILSKEWKLTIEAFKMSDCENKSLFTSNMCQICIRMCILRWMWVKITNDKKEVFFIADIVTCQSWKSTGVTNNINDGDEVKV